MVAREVGLLLASLVLLIIALTLGPHLSVVYAAVSAPVAAVLGDRPTEYLLNGLLFLPLGVLAGTARHSAPILVVAMLAIAVEAAQLLLPRDAELFDLAAYVSGVLVGTVVGARLGGAREPGEHDGG